MPSRPTASSAASRTLRASGTPNATAVATTTVATTITQRTNGSHVGTLLSRMNAQNPVTATIAASVARAGV